MAYEGEQKREYQRKWIAARRAKWFAGKSCKICGTQEKLVLHHINPSEKEHHAIWSWSWERILKEVEKCIVLCDYHHREHHADEIRLIDYHGTNTGYINYRCRCCECKKAHAIVNSRYRG